MARFPIKNNLIRMVALTALVTGGVSATSHAAPRAIPKEMESLFPIGRTFRGVKIPSYSDNNLQMVLEAEEITRVDAIYLDLNNVLIKTYSSDGSVETRIVMKEARYHMVTGKLFSKTPAEVKHEKFTMTGEQMSFDTVEEVSTMEGDVRVVIPKASEFTGGFGLPDAGNP